MFGRRRHPEPPAGPGGLSRDHVIWAYRLLLDREPESEDVIGPKLAGSADTRELRHHLMTSAEFQERNPDYAHSNDRTVVIKELDGDPAVRLFIDLSDHVIGIGILRDRYEQDAIAWMRTFVRPGDSVVDVGAHIGFYAMHMAAAVGPEGRVCAFEPLDANADLLERSIRENRFEERVALRRVAVGGAPGRAAMAFAAETLNSGGAYLLRDGTRPVAGGQIVDTEVVTLDAEPLVRPVRLIKMDVEGAEPLVLEGARLLLANDRPAILSELHPEQLARVSGITADRFVSMCGELGYSVHALNNGVPGPRFDRGPSEVVTSVLLWPVDRGEPPLPRPRTAPSG